MPILIQWWKGGKKLLKVGDFTVFKVLPFVSFNTFKIWCNFEDIKIGKITLDIIISKEMALCVSHIEAKSLYLLLGVLISEKKIDVSKVQWSNFTPQSQSLAIIFEVGTKPEAKLIYY